MFPHQHQVPRIQILLYPKDDNKTTLAPLVSTKALQQALTQLCTVSSVVIPPNVADLVLPGFTKEKPSEAISQIPEQVPEMHTHLQPHVSTSTSLQMPTGPQQVCSQSLPEVPSLTAVQVHTKATLQTATHARPQIASRNTRHISAQVTPLIISRTTPNISSHFTPQVASQSTRQISSETALQVTTQNTPHTSSHTTTQTTPQLTSQTTLHISAHTSQNINTCCATDRV